MLYKKIMFGVLVSVVMCQDVRPNGVSEDNQQIVKPISKIFEVENVQGNFPCKDVAAVFERCGLGFGARIDTYKEKAEGGKSLQKVLQQLDEEAQWAANKAPLGQEEQAREAIYQHVPCVVRNFLGEYASEKVIDDVTRERSLSKDGIAIKKIRSIIAPAALQKAREKFIAEGGKPDYWTDNGLSASFPDGYGLLRTEDVPNFSKQGLFVVADGDSTPKVLLTPTHKVAIFSSCVGFNHSPNNAPLRHNLFKEFADKVTMQFCYNTCENNLSKKHPKFRVTKEGTTKECELSELEQFKGTDAQIESDDECRSVYKVVAVDGKPTVKPVL